MFFPNRWGLGFVKNLGPWWGLQTLGYRVLGRVLVWLRLKRNQPHSTTRNLSSISPHSFDFGKANILRQPLSLAIFCWVEELLGGWDWEYQVSSHPPWKRGSSRWISAFHGRRICASGWWQRWDAVDATERCHASERNPRSRKPPRNRRLQPLTRCLAPVRSCCAWTALAPNCLDFSNVSPINVGKEMGMSFSPTSYGIWIYHDLPKMGDTPKLQLWWVNYNKAWDFGSDKPTWLGILVNIFRMVIRVWLGFAGSSNGWPWHKFWGSETSTPWRRPTSAVSTSSWSGSTRQPLACRLGMSQKWLGNFGPGSKVYKVVSLVSQVDWRRVGWSNLGLWQIYHDISIVRWVYKEPNLGAPPWRF